MYSKVVYVYTHIRVKTVVLQQENCHEGHLNNDSHLMQLIGTGKTGRKSTRLLLIMCELVELLYITNSVLVTHQKSTPENL